MYKYFYKLRLSECDQAGQVILGNWIREWRSIWNEDNSERITEKDGDEDDVS